MEKNSEATPTVRVIATFKLDRDDLQLLEKVVSRRLMTMNNGIAALCVFSFFAWLAVGFAINVFIGLYSKAEGIASDLTLVAVSLLVSGLLIWAEFLSRRHLKRRVLFDEKGTFLQERTIEFSAEHVRAVSASYEVIYKWSAFFHVDEDDKNLYLFVDNSIAIPVPKSALTQEDGIDQIRLWHSASSK